MDKIPLTSFMKSADVRRHIISLVVGLLLVLVFVSIVAFLREFKPEAAGFEQKGPLLLLYHLARLGLAFFITVLCYSAGYRALELVRISPRKLFENARQTFILCFFVGASLYGIAFSVLGLLGLIGLASGLALTLPVLLLSFHPIRALLPESIQAAMRQAFVDTHANRFFAQAIVLAAGGAAVIFLLTRVVFVPNVDGNIWEHYLHYYREVLGSGSTQPSEVWHHFYNSKGGGLVFLANVLSDFFGVQLVSACFVVVAGLIILDLLLEHCRSISWSFFGVLLYFTFLFGNVTDGGMFRVHGVLLGYAGFAVWGSVRLQQATEPQFRPLMTALVVSLAYLGFYLPVASAIFPLAFLLFVLTNLTFRDKTRLSSFAILACAVFAGTTLVLLTNWILTGLPELTPIRWWWAIADRLKVENVLGLGGIDFFMAVNNDLIQGRSWSHNFVSAIRYPVPKQLVYLSLLGALILLIHMLVRYVANKSTDTPARFLVQIIAFVIPLCIFATMVPSPSVYRMGLFSIVFTTLAVVVIWKQLVDISLGGLRFSLHCVERDDGTVVQFKIKLWHAATALVIIIGMVSAFAQAKQGARKQWPVIRQYVEGVESLRGAMQKMESLGGKPPVTSVAAISDFRRTTSIDGRILSLGYDAGYAYLLPGEGIVSEPTYALIKNPGQILAATPGDVVHYLRERDISYFALNLGSRLFTTIAFTSLFDPKEMPKYFSVAYKDQDFLILGWRYSDQEKPLSEEILTLFELKRTGVLNYPFTKKFADLMSGSANRLVDDLRGFEKVRDDFEGDLNRLLSAQMLSRVSLETSRVLLRRILNAARDAVRSPDPGTVLGIQWRSFDPPRILIPERELRGHLVDLVRDAIYKEYIAELGDELASLSRNCDERIPFAISYPVDAKC